LKTIQLIAGITKIVACQIIAGCGFLLARLLGSIIKAKSMPVCRRIDPRGIQEIRVNLNQKIAVNCIIKDSMRIITAAVATSFKLQGIWGSRTRASILAGFFTSPYTQFIKVKSSDLIFFVITISS
jgi:hypothetical protein